MRSFWRAAMNSRTTCFTTVKRSTAWLLTSKSMACMLPDTSTARTISIPSVLTRVSLRPSCGRARAMINRTSAATRSVSRNPGPSRVQKETRPRPAATEEYWIPPPPPRRCSHQSQSGTRMSRIRNHGCCSLTCWPPPWMVLVAAQQDGFVRRMLGLLQKPVADRPTTAVTGQI